MKRRNNENHITLIIGLVLVTGLIVMLLFRYPQVVSALTKKATIASVKYELNGSAPLNTSERIINETEYIEAGISHVGFDESLSISPSPLWRLELAPEENETPATHNEINQPVISSEEGKGELPYPFTQETRSGTIQEKTYGNYSGNQYINLDRAGLVRNCTSVSNLVLDEEGRKLPEFKIETGTSEPQVLIMHTHTTESFEPYERDFYDASFSSRSTDNSMNVVAVGEEIAKGLEEKGITVIHNTTIHDYPSYNGSYQRSNQTVKEILEQYPSIKVVLDIHRDAICPENNLRIAPVTEIDGKKAAQIMIISGCDDGTMGMPNYLQNFRLASIFQQTTEEMYPTLTRPVLFDYRNYNQELTTGSLLIEVGSHANSIDEVIYTGELLGDALGEALLKCR